MSPPPLRRYLLAGGVEIQTPAANQHHVVPSTGLYVSGACGNDVEKVWIKILRKTATVPTDPTTDPAGGWVEADLGAGTFSKNNVTGGVTTQITGSDDNKVVAIPEGPIGTFGTADIVYFRGRPAHESLNVSARACLWFAFAADGLPGPGPANDREDDTANHRPVSFVVPANADQVTIEATGNWSHYGAVGGNDTSDADGMNPSTALELAGYRSGTYLSETIADLDEKVNTLIGMWVDVDAAPIGSPFAIGKGPTALSISDTVRKLFLAFHDGKRWHNNQGQVAVTLDWSVVVNFLRLRGV
jgi:hypothetical protein